MVPKGWFESAISDLSISVKVGFVGTCQADYREIGVPMIRTTNLRDGKLDLEGLIFVTKEFHEKNKKSQLKENDLLIARHGNHGQASLVPSSLGEANCLNIVIVRPNPRLVHPQFMLDLFNFDLQKKFASKAAGSTQSVINTKEIAKQKACVPPLEEQKKISQILNTWDKSIATIELLIANSKHQKKALMQKLLTGTKRLLDKDAVSFIEEWKPGRLSDLSTITKGKALSSKDLTQGIYPVIAGGKTSPYNHSEFTHDNAITVSASGAYAGYVAYHPYRFWASDCSVVRNKEGADIGFIFQLMMHMQSKIYSLQSGGAQPHVYPKDLDTLHIHIPPIEEQQKISNILSAADNEITALERKLNLLTQEKKGLMQKLLTGKLRVKIH